MCRQFPPEQEIQMTNEHMKICHLINNHKNANENHKDILL